MIPDYAAVKLFIRFGPALAALVVIGLGACLGWIAATATVPWPLIALGAAATLLIGLFLLVFVDLTKIIAEMLLPR